MLSKEEIEKAKDDLNFFNEGDYITREMDKSANILKKYIEELEKSDASKEQSNMNYYNECKKLKQENSKLNKMIDKMAKQLAGLAIWDNEKQETLILGDKEEIKQYYEEKVKEEVD